MYLCFVLYYTIALCAHCRITALANYTNIIHSLYHVDCFDPPVTTNMNNQQPQVPIFM